MGSTYLELTNRVLRRLNEVELDLSTFASARGVHAAVKDAVLDTVRDINSQKFEWPFNNAAASQVLDVGVEEYFWPDDLRVPDWTSFYIEKDDTLGVSTTPLRQINRDEWYKFLRKPDYDSTTDGRSRPQFVFESGNGGFGVSPSPNQEYTVNYDYWIKTIDLDTYDDETTIPSEYDYVITDGAMNLLYTFLDNEERATIALAAYKKGLSYMSFLLVPKDAYAYDRVIARPGRYRNKMWNGY